MTTIPAIVPFDRAPLVGLMTNFGFIFYRYAGRLNQTSMEDFIQNIVQEPSSDSAKVLHGCAADILSESQTPDWTPQTIYNKLAALGTFFYFFPESVEDSAHDEDLQTRMLDFLSNEAVHELLQQMTLYIVKWTLEGSLTLKEIQTFVRELHPTTRQ